MSQALPMSDERRHDIHQAGGGTWRQYRQFVRMANRNHYRTRFGMPHGATGEKTRRPLVFTSKPPERGSIRTHIAAYCAPCDQHGGLLAPWDPNARPRLHRYAVDNVHGSVTA